MKRMALLVAAGLLATSCSFGGADTSGKVVAYFRDVGDLVERATVQVADVEVGRISAIDLVLEDGEMLARVTMSIEPQERIPADELTAVVRQTSLLGEQFVELVPKTSGAPFVGTEQTVVTVDRTDRRVDVETFLSDLSSLIGEGGLEDLNRFTHAQAMILEDRGSRFGETIEELERFTGVLADRKLDIGAAIDNLAGAGRTLVANKQTLDDFLDSLEDANALLADEGDELRTLFASLRRFGGVSARFLVKHEDAIDRQFRALRPILRGLAGAQGELRTDIQRLSVFFDLFPKSLGGGPGGSDQGDYVQAEAVLCEVLARCHTRGEKGDVPGEGS